MRAALAILLAFSALPLQPPGPTAPQQLAQGQLEEALTAYRATPNLAKSVAANNGAGVTLDLLGRYPEAQVHFAHAIKAAKTPLEVALARRAMAISHGFARDCKGAEKYESAAFEFYLGTGDFYNAGEVADELGRLCLDAGDLYRAEEWYRKGNATGLDEPNISRQRTDLWDFRLTHARARIAAVRGRKAEAGKLLAQAKAILDRGTNHDQETYFPYLTGYVAFYAKDYPRALAAWKLAPQNDPFIQCMTAQTYEALGDREHALEFYRLAANSRAHSVPAAYAQPFARRKLE
jgi:tetratricopeptide (TPR) repeat protein